MLSSQSAVVEGGALADYEERLRRLVTERAQQDEKMQEMQRELERMRASQQQSTQQPLVIKLTDYSASNSGTMRSLPPIEKQQSEGKLGVHTNKQYRRINARRCASRWWLAVWCCVARRPAVQFLM